MWHLEVVERISAYDGKTPEGGSEKYWSILTTSIITELEFVKFEEELQPVMTWDDDRGLRAIASDKVAIGWPQAEVFQGGGVFRAGPALGQSKVHIHEVPHPVEIYIDEATLDFEALEHFPSRFNSLVIPILCDIGKEARMERGSFGTVEEGRPTFDLAVPMAPWVMSADGLGRSFSCQR